MRLVFATDWSSEFGDFGAHFPKLLGVRPAFPFAFVAVEGNMAVWRTNERNV